MIRKFIGEINPAVIEKPALRCRGGRRGGLGGVLGVFSSVPGTPRPLPPVPGHQRCSLLSYAPAPGLQPRGGGNPVAGVSPAPGRRSFPGATRSSAAGGKAGKWQNKTRGGVCLDSAVVPRRSSRKNASRRRVLHDGCGTGLNSGTEPVALSFPGASVPPKAPGVPRLGRAQHRPPQHRALIHLQVQNAVYFPPHRAGGKAWGII